MGYYINGEEVGYSDFYDALEEHADGACVWEDDGNTIMVTNQEGEV